MLLAMFKRLILTFLKFEIFEIKISKLFIVFRNKNFEILGFVKLFPKYENFEIFIFRYYNTKVKNFEI